MIRIPMNQRVFNGMSHNFFIPWYRWDDHPQYKELIDTGMYIYIYID